MSLSKRIRYHSRKLSKIIRGTSGSDSDDVSLGNLVFSPSKSASNSPLPTRPPTVVGSPQASPPLSASSRPRVNQLRQRVEPPVITPGSPPIPLPRQHPRRPRHRLRKFSLRKSNSKDFKQNPGRPAALPNQPGAAAYESASQVLTRSVTDPGAFEPDSDLVERATKFDLSPRPRKNIKCPPSPLKDHDFWNETGQAVSTAVSAPSTSKFQQQTYLPPARELFQHHHQFAGPSSANVHQELVQDIGRLLTRSTTDPNCELDYGLSNRGCDSPHAVQNLTPFPLPSSVSAFPQRTNRLLASSIFDPSSRESSPLSFDSDQKASNGVALPSCLTSGCDLQSCVKIDPSFSSAEQDSHTRADDTVKTTGLPLNTNGKGHSPHLSDSGHSFETDISQSKMAAIRASTFFDPSFERFSRLPESQRFTRNEAKQQEAIIHAKLKNAGVPIPPYEFINFIGKGTYGRVYSARDTRSNRRVAIKVVDVDVVDYKMDAEVRNANLDVFMQEYKVLKQLTDFKAENVSQIFELLQVHSQIWIVSEFCPGGSVHTLMQSMNNKIEEKYIRIIARELAKALKAVHDADIIHRDVKAGNIMIHEKGSLQLIDFGVAGQLVSRIDKRNTVIGTVHWMAPEMLHGIVQDAGQEHGKEVDVWSYGITLIEMATGQPPNSRLLPAQLEKHLKRTPPRMKPEVGISQELCDFVAFTLELEPSKRATMDLILEHPYIRDSEESHPTVLLADLVKVFNRWASAGGQRVSLLVPTGAEAATSEEVVANPEWRFSTLETTETLERLSSNVPFDFVEDGDNETTMSIRHRPSAHVNPLADISSAQAQEDSLNSYFAGEPADEDFNELADEIYKQSVPASTYENGNYTPDEASINRGAHHLRSLFGHDTYNTDPHESRHEPSDLPLRSQHPGIARQDTDGSTGGSSRSGRNLANIDTMRANSYNANRPPTMNMSWDFPVKAHNQGHPNLDNWAVDAGYGSPSDDFESSYDEEPYPPPSRPALRHAATEPIHAGEEGNGLNVDLARGSRLDMDALMGGIPGASSLYAAPTQPLYQQSLPVLGSTTAVEVRDEGLDLDAIISDADVESLNDTYADPGNTPRDLYGRQQPAERYHNIESQMRTVPVPQPPSEEAMTAGAPQIVLEMEFERLSKQFNDGLETLLAQFDGLVEEDPTTTATNGEAAAMTGRA